MIDPLITSVAFGEDHIQINFMEQSDQSQWGTLEQSLLLNLEEDDGELVMDIQEALGELIDNYKLKLRNPPDKIERKNRFSRDEEDDD